MSRMRAGCRVDAGARVEDAGRINECGIGSSRSLYNRGGVEIFLLLF